MTGNWICFLIAKRSTDAHSTQELRAGDLAVAMRRANALADLLDETSSSESLKFLCDVDSIDKKGLKTGPKHLHFWSP